MDLPDELALIRINQNQRKDIIYSGPKLKNSIDDAYLSTFSFRAILRSDKIKPLFVGKFSGDVVGGYFLPVAGGIILFVPPWDKVNKSLGVSYGHLTYLEKLDLLATELLNNRNSMSELPMWASDYRLPEEQKAQDSIAGLKEKIAELSNQIDFENEKIQQQQQWKLLFTAHDVAFEDAVKKALESLGCVVEKGPRAHGDLIANFNGELIVFEAKGIGKSANKSHVTQCSGWADEIDAAYSIDSEERDVIQKRYCDILERLGFSLVDLQAKNAALKSVLVLNTFKDKELVEREVAFPDNIQKLMKNKNVCGLTGIQLIGAIVHSNVDPNAGADFLQKIIKCNGVLSDFINWENFLIKK
jgi:hypothetical protein